MGDVAFLIAGIILGAAVSQTSKVSAENGSYKCTNSLVVGCSDLCCKFCLASDSCQHICSSDPSTCGQSVKIK